MACVALHVVLSGKRLDGLGTLRYEQAKSERCAQWQSDGYPTLLI